MGEKERQKIPISISCGIITKAKLGNICKILKLEIKLKPILLYLPFTKKQTDNEISSNLN